jgi:tRNA uridine 5-carboxymethylaminomethyl modification enzyme
VRCRAWSRPNAPSPATPVDYDFRPADRAATVAECKRIPGLFLPGQINGTSGLRGGAGAQGLIAGANAALGAPWTRSAGARRDEGDSGFSSTILPTRGCREPYRMFTSRGPNTACCCGSRQRRPAIDARGVERRTSSTMAGGSAYRGEDRRLDRNRTRLQSVDAPRRRRPQLGLAAPEAAGRPAGRRRSGPRPGADGRAGELDARASRPRSSTRATSRASGSRSARRARDEARGIPEDFRYAGVPGLSNEIVQRLTEIRPETVGQASACLA